MKNASFPQRKTFPRCQRELSKFNWTFCFQFIHEIEVGGGRASFFIWKLFDGKNSSGEISWRWENAKVQAKCSLKWLQPRSSSFADQLAASGGSLCEGFLYHLSVTFREPFGNSQWLAEGLSCGGDSMVILGVSCSGFIYSANRETCDKIDGELWCLLWWNV